MVNKNKDQAFYKQVHTYIDFLKLVRKLIHREGYINPGLRHSIPITWITFQWDKLTAMKHVSADRNGNSLLCIFDCNLHFLQSHIQTVAFLSERRRR